MSYTASAAIERICLKAWLSKTRGLTDPEILELLNDSLRSYVVPFLKDVRDEWFVSGVESVTPDANGRIAMPDSVASTIRTVEWLNNGQPTPLARIEPERAFAYEGQSGSGAPCGYVLRGYGLQMLPTNVGSISVRLRFMERPAELVLDEDAAEIESVAGPVITLSSVPLSWQTSAPTTVALISNESPFSAVVEEASVVDLTGDQLTISSFDAALVEDGFWVADVGSSPFPNIPVELHPLLQLDVMRVIYEGTGDARLAGIQKRQEKTEAQLRKLLSPRTQGTARPIVNPSAPGMRTSWMWRG